MRTAPAAHQGTISSPGITRQVTPILSIEAAPEQPEPVPQTAENSAFQEIQLIRPSEKLSWANSKIHKVLYNNRIEDWMKADPGFYNWVRTCIMMHADNGCDETRCTVPDQWREDVGKVITIVTADYLPGRKGETHEPKTGVYRVMA